MLARLLVGCVAMLCSMAGLRGAEPVKLYAGNPHYVEFRGKPTVLITSGEHYGAVLNSAFDSAKYLSTIEKLGFNLTRTFSGVYCEEPGAFKITDNTLAPGPGKLISPWKRSGEPGYIGGGNKFDLGQWDEAYFGRLKSFLTEAGKRGIVVEFVLFCPFYEDSMWVRSPMNAGCNVNGVGKVAREAVYTLKDKELTRVQEEVTRKLVRELKDFDNLYYEICNEPYFGGVTLEWQAHIARVITEEEQRLGVKHLIAQNIANGSSKIERPDPNVSIFNFHYATPPKTVDENYGLKLVIGDDETGFKGTAGDHYRIEGWEFLMAGGGIYSNLDYTFAVGKEDGTSTAEAPGSVDRSLHRQLGYLKKFLDQINVVEMGPAQELIESVVPAEVRVRVLNHDNKRLGVYIVGKMAEKIGLRMPAGEYRITWVDTKTGQLTERKGSSSGGILLLSPPPFTDDIAARVDLISQ